MKIIDVNIHVISDDIIYLTVTSKNVCNDSGDWLNYSKFTLRFKHLSRAFQYVSHMICLLPDKDYHVSVNIVRAL